MNEIECQSVKKGTKERNASKFLHAFNGPDHEISSKSLLSLKERGGDREFSNASVTPCTKKQLLATKEFSVIPNYT